jgi:hypothetical protein
MKHFRSVTNANALARRFGGGGGGGGGGGTAWTNGGVVTSFAGNTRGDVDGTEAGPGISTNAFINDFISYTIGDSPLLVLQDGNIVYATVNPTGSGRAVYYLNGSTYTRTLLAGGADSYSDGTGAAAGFGIINGMVQTSSGNIIVTDVGNYTIRQITYPGGVVTTLIDVGTDSFSSPVVLPDGNIAFVSSTDDLRYIYVLTPSNSVYLLAGGGDPGAQGFTDGTGASAYFSTINAMCLLPNGNLAVMDYLYFRIVTYPEGVVTQLTGGTNGIYNSGSGYLDGPGYQAQFASDFSAGQICALSDGTIVVPDVGNYRIRLVNSTTGYVSTLAGNGVAVSVDGTGSSAGFGGLGFCTLRSNGTILVADGGLLRSITQAGVVRTISFSSFFTPRGIAILSDGNIVVADVSNNRIRKITYPGAITTALAGSTSGNVDGTGGAALFRSPYATAVLQNGDIAVVDQTNCTIRIVTYPGGVVSTLAGFGSGGYLDATGTAAKFGTMYGIGVLANGNIVVTDSANRRIRMITSGGVVTTLAGQTTSGAIVNGIGTTARFSTTLRGLTVLQDGKIAVADSGNNAIRLVDPFTPTPAYSAATATAGSTVTTLATLTAVYSLATLPDGNIAALTTSGAVYIVNYATGTAGTVTALSGATGFAASSYIAAIPSTTKLIVADSTNNQIKLIT